MSQAIRRFWLLLGLGLSLGPWALAADDISDLFETPTPEAQASSAEGSSTVLSEYTKKQDKISCSFDVYAAGGMYAGYTTEPNWSDLSSGLTHSSVGALYLYSHLDLRPVDILRIYGTVYTSYPSFGLTVSELYLDYGGPWKLATKMGKYSLAWGNARILTIADLPNRAIDLSDVSDSSNILPSWLKGNSPALWLRSALPLGNYTATLLMTLPSDTTSGLSEQGYGLLNELTLGKWYVSLAGYYRYNLTPRLSASAKTSLRGMDLFMDSTLSFPTDSEPLACVTGGLYYQTTQEPDIKVTAELRWNGEKPGTTALIQDAMAIGGLSQALAVVWSSVGGSSVSLGGTWYHDWTDGSGAVVPNLSWDLGKLLSLKMVLPLVYGDSGSSYRVNPPSEANGYAEGLGILLLLKTSF